METVSNAKVASEEEEVEQIPVTTTNNPRFNINEKSQEIQMLQYLQEHGYVVIASVASEQNIISAKELFWNIFCNINSNINCLDPSTWDTDWPASSGDGICSAKGFNHSQFLWQARLFPDVKRAFGLIWNTEDLIVSYDTGNVFRPWQYNREWLTHGGWWHTDQNALKVGRQGRRCIQGLVTYFDANELTGGLCVIPGSHLAHDEVSLRSANGDKSMDYISIKKGDPILANGGLLVCAKAGDLILWDSRTVHCNTPALTSLYEDNTSLASTTSAARTSAVSEAPSSDAVSGTFDIIRLAAYVCMLPVSHANAKCIEQRKLAFTRRVSTSHWPTQMIGINMKRVVEDPIDPSTCSDDLLALVGYSLEERQQILSMSTR